MTDTVIEGKDGKFYRVRAKEQPPTATPEPKTVPDVPAPASEAPLASKKEYPQWVKDHIAAGHDKPRRIVGVRMFHREDD